MCHPNTQTFISLSDFMPPCEVHGDAIQIQGCLRYHVKVPCANNIQKQMTLLEYDLCEDSLRQFEAAASTLHRLKDSDTAGSFPNFWSFSSHPDARYILIDVDTSNVYTLEDIAQKPLAERFQILIQTLNAIDKLLKQGILPGQIQWEDVLCNDPENPVIWNMTNAYIRDDCPPEDWEQKCSTTTVGLAHLTYNTIVGSNVSSEYIIPHLILALCNKMASSYLQAFCEELEKFFHQEGNLSNLIEHLESVQIKIEAYSKNATQNPQVSYLTAANFLYQHPLYPYVRTTPAMSKALHVVLYGGSAMCKTFLQAIIPAAQMLDTQLYIHIVVTDTQNFWKECKDAFPLLDQVVTVTHIPAVADSASVLSKKIVGTDRNGQRRPFACLTIEAASQLPDLENDMVDCLFLLDSYDDTASAKICDLISHRDHPLLIGICRDQDKDGSKSGDIQSFPVIGTENPTRICTFSQEEPQFSAEDSELYRKAFGIHTYWAKNYDQRETPEKTKKDFLDSYNRDSSIRTVLSIPYKLYSCGISEKDDVSQRFYDEILHNTDKTMVRRLAWLEHRSWQAHLILNGWKLNPVDFAGGFDTAPFSQKNTSEKWHACLHGTNDKRTALACWKNEDWDDINKDLSPLDPLERISVKIHQRLVAKVANHAADLKTCMDNLLGTLSPHMNHSVHTVIDQLIADVPNAALGWAHVYDELKNKYPTDANVEKLGALAQELIQRNKRQDYKQIDLPLLDAIPYLQQDNPIRRIYKLYTDRAWDNIAASIFAEPVELILVPQKGHDVPDIKRYADFLKDERHMTTTVTAETLETLEQMSQAGPDTVLDVTGADAAQILEAQQHCFLKTLPMIEYKNGGLDTPDGKYPNARYYSKNRSLTVDETMRINGATVIQVDIPMYSMYQYKELWEVVQLTAKDYGNIIYYFSTKRDPVSVYRSSYEWVTDMPQNAATASGLTTLLNSMASNHLIQSAHSYPLIQPYDAKYGHRMIVALNKVVGKIKAAASPISFQLYDDTTSWKINEGGNTIALISKSPLLPWSTTYSLADAQTYGLYNLLTQLKNAGIIEPFSFCAGSTTTVTAVDPYCQFSLNKMLNEYVASITHGKHSTRHLSFPASSSENLCQLQNMDLEFNETLSIHVNKVTLQGKEVSTASVKTFLDALEEKNLIRQVGSTPIWNTSGLGSNVNIHFQFSDPIVMDCVLKAGNALEALTYHTIRQMNCFDDVKLGVSFQWENQNVTGKDTTNEIDVICTKGMKSFFISCKQTFDLNNDYLTEIRYETDRFGLEGVPILVTTAQEKDNPYQYARAKRMGIHIITLTKEIHYSPSSPDGVNELETQLTALLTKL